MGSNEKKAIGFIGLGIMGRHMAAHLLAAGFQMHLHTRTKEKAADLLAKGANWCDHVGGVAKRADLIITMVGTPAEVQRIYLSADGIIENARAGTYLVDMTTSDPELAVRIYEAAKLKELHACDAPVSGGEIGARDAKLTVMVGGDAEDFDVVAPLLNRLGSNVVHQGKAGNGQHTKMCNQIINANTLVGVAEGLAYAHAAGLDVNAVLKSITTGSAASFHLSNTGAKILDGDFRPGFAVKHMVKDLNIAQSEAAGLGITLPGLRGALERYRQLLTEGLGEEGVQSIYKTCGTSARRAP